MAQKKKEAPSPSLPARLWQRLTSIATTPVPESSTTTYQFQVIVTREFPLDEAEQADVLQFFLDARDRLRQKFAIDSADGRDGTATDSTNS